MSTASTIRRTATLILSAAITTPAMAAPKFNYDPPAIVQAAPSGAGALVKKVDFTVNGRKAYAVFALVPAESTHAVLESVARTNPDNITLGVKGADDPILEELKDLPLNPKNIVAIDEDVSKTSGAKFEKDADLKKRFLDHVKDAGDQMKTKRWNTLAAFGYAGTVSIGQVYVMSGSLSNVAMTFVPVGSLALFVATQSSYGQLLNASGKGMESVVAKTWKAAGLGKELPDKGKRFARATGQFLPIYGASVAQTALVTHMSGQHVDASHLMVHAFANNYAVWDAVVSHAIATHLLPHTFEMPYFLVQYVVFTAAELMAYQGVPGVETALAVVSGMGLLALLNPQYVESVVVRASVMMRFRSEGNGRTKLLATSIPKLQRRVAMLRLARQISGASARSCELGLAKVAATKNPWAPSSWRPGFRMLDGQ